MKSAWSNWWSEYASVSTRTLALWRIALGLTASANVIYYWRSADVFYSHEGALPSALNYVHSPLELLNAPWQLNAYFALTLIACLAFAAGVRGAKWVAPFLTAMFFQRGTMIVTGGHAVIQLAFACSWLLPVCENYSVHAWRKGGNLGGNERRYSGPGYPLVLLQLGVNYTFNTLNKFTDSWESGVAVERALGNAMVSSPLGHHLADAPPWFLEMSTYGTLVVEGSLPLLILTPWGRRRAHLIAAILMLGLHGMIVVTMQVGMFGWAMLCQIPLLLARPSGETFGALHSLEPPPGQLRGRRWGAALLLYAMAVSLTSPTNSAGLNKMGKFSQVPVPQMVRYSFAGLNLNQGWGMFAYPLDRSYVAVVHAETKDGIMFDPWRARAAGDETPLKSVPRAAYDSHVFSSYEANILVGLRLTEPFAYWVLHQAPEASPENDAIRFASWTLLVPAEQEHRLEWDAIKRVTGLTPLPIPQALPVRLESFGVWEPERTVDGLITDDGSHVLSPTGSAFAPHCGYLILHLEQPTHLRSLYVQGDAIDRYVIEGSQDGTTFNELTTVPSIRGRQYRSRLVSLDAPGTVAVRIRSLSTKPRNGYINEVALFDHQVTLPPIPEQKTAHMVANHTRPAAVGLASETRANNGYCSWEQPGSSRKPHWRPKAVKHLPPARSF